MPWELPETVPTPEGYINWIRTRMAVPVSVLSDDSPYISDSYYTSLEYVNLYLDIASPIVYTKCVYNLGGAYLVETVQDDPNLPPPDNTYWKDLRVAFNMNTFMPGFVNSAFDQGTGAGVQLLQGMEGLTIIDLQLAKTPWGQYALGIMQSVGTMWGLS
jgi:hypothetical protein